MQRIYLHGHQPIYITEQHLQPPPFLNDFTSFTSEMFAPLLTSSMNTTLWAFFPRSIRTPCESVRTRGSLLPLMMQLCNGAALPPGDFGDFADFGDSWEDGEATSPLPSPAPLAGMD